MWHDPRIAANVTNAIAAQFIETNLKVRETMAMGTTVFLTNETTKLKKELETQEKSLVEFKKKHMGMLPDQLQANINILGQLKEQHNNIEMKIRNEHEKSMFLQRQIELLQDGETDSDKLPISGSKRLKHLNAKLENLLARYTEKHPDVIALKRAISELATKPSP